ncbi:hypothetical protein RFI_31757 [Reticulomyxa filosa]|uniref:Uncharacterized protein n=1 Tax=Reticulomyxa filosa TaxID=46433 RepID=X6LUM5_RETFI|nr:hypothetical protein RFI_31757 [Reticulomyxa filosa]|eukprot:ETO05638.1 hypothetical protein RFI_31757 [Reticulomyxa filosa]
MQETLWKCPLEDMTNLAKAILKLHLKGQEFVKMIRKCCDMDLNTISTMVNKADKIWTSLKQLKDAMTVGEWQFASCEDALQGKKEKKLILKIANIVWSCEEIEENIDRVLLGVEKQELENIEPVIRQFEECKKISSYRIKFWKKEGRIDIENNKKGGNQDNDKPLKLPVCSQMYEFERCKQFWKQRLIQWKKQCLKLREKFPALNYFCFNEIHYLIHQFNTLLSPSCHNRPFQAFKSIKSFLQKINCQITDQDVDKVLQEWQDLKALTNSKIWKSRNASDVDSDEDYEEHIADVGTILHSVWHASKHNCVIENVFPVGLHAGKPNLILFQNKPLLSEVLVLFELQKYIPRAEHILICNKNTTEEEVICLIFRAITNDKRIKMAITTKMDWNSAKPLYCLVYPENLTLSTLKQVCHVVQDLLLNSVQVKN